MRTKLTMIEGDTWRWKVQVTDAAGGPWDFSGLTAVMELRRKPSGAPAFATLTSGDGLTLDSPEPGWITVAVPSNATAGLCAGKVVEVYADLEVRSADNPPVVTTLAQFEVSVQWEATRV